ncbi:MAG: photosystem reaction center protein H [Burkholderiales bacterium PBB4]|nr:MAG: photosystem reaction center protein H [Burkholderiales bacterium PBB4]
MKIALTACALAVCTLVFAPASVAQVAGGSTTVGMRVTESTQLALGWSVKKTLLGKTIYNESDQKVGKVEDLIISPDKSVSYVIVGAGGFLGMGRHDVAIPVTQIQDQGGKLVMAGATKDMLKALPAFDYANDTAKRDQFIANTEQDIAKAKARIAELEKSASTAASDAKAKMDLQISGLQIDLKATEGKLSDLKQATAKRWHEFEASVNAATLRLRKSIDKAVG